MLLQVLEEASVSEVVDVSTEEHHLWVDVIGHTAVGGHGVVSDGWHHEGSGAVAYTLPSAFYQGTKSEKNIWTPVTRENTTYVKSVMQLKTE